MPGSSGGQTLTEPPLLIQKIEIKLKAVGDPYGLFPYPEPAKANKP